ncbi:M14 family zinc carboxypeptidase [Nocardioides sp. LHG3406-4]|uniref:M14 family zinc carboxypeptidase n=1 Tax=Nocardioides sp. LHG3406-4 TaxID=2804575 RepID=UPI003CF4FC02
MRRVLCVLSGLAVVLSVAPPAPAAPPAGADAGADARPAVVERRVIGHSVQGRPIVAWRLGEPGARRVVLVSSMHGNEDATAQILDRLRDGRRYVRGIDLWVVPSYNPDGIARGTRRNAHGVDLNRNYPYRWVRLDGNYESGPRPGSEPETRAMMAFLTEIAPHRVISFHQPLNGVDTDTKDPGFARRLARRLHLPTTRLMCGGLCHGTMTMWFNRHFEGSALTVEYGARPGRHRLRVQAPRQVLDVLGARRSKRPPPGR